MGKYSSEQKKEILSKLDNLAEELGSMSKTTEFTGVSSSVISSLKSGKYKGDEDGMYEKIEAYFEARENAEMVGIDSENYVPTSISENVYANIKNCQLKGGLAVACGDAGVGKTKAAQKFAGDNPNHCILITANPCVKGIKSILKCLCEKLSISEKSIDEMWFAIAGKLRDKMVIVIDEAQHLPIKTIEALRAFSDYFNDKGQTLGIIFVGNNETVHNFRGGKRADFAQIINRTKQNRQYYTTQITKKDVEKLFPVFVGREKEIDFLHAIAQSKQALRGASNLYGQARDNGNITYEGLVAMAKHMEMEI